MGKFSLHKMHLFFSKHALAAPSTSSSRPHDRERASLIPSRKLVYREPKHPFPPGDKKRAMKRSKRLPGIIKDVDEELFTSASFAETAKTSHSQLGFEHRGSLDKIFRRYRRGPRSPRTFSMPKYGRSSLPYPGSLFHSTLATKLRVEW